MNTPTHPRPVHSAHAASGNVAGLFQARCSCGWRGLIVDETSASSAAVAHAATFGPESPIEHALRDGGDESFRIVPGRTYGVIPGHSLRESDALRAAEDARAEGA